MSKSTIWLEQHIMFICKYVYLYLYMFVCPMGVCIYIQYILVWFPLTYPFLRFFFSFTLFSHFHSDLTDHNEIRCFCPFCAILAFVDAIHAWSEPPPLCKGGIRFFKNGCNVGRGVAIFTGNGREPGMEGVGGVGFIMGRDGKFLKSVYIVSRGVLSAYFMKTPLYCLSPPPLSSHLQMNETHTHTTQHAHTHQTLRER